MTRRRGQAAARTQPTAEGESFPVREYVAVMAAEMALMARGEGDEVLAGALELAALIARGNA